MVRIRLTRIGAKKNPFYRVVVADSRSPRDGANLELIGHYNPMVEPPVVKIDLDRVDYWISKGAQPSETVVSLVKKARAAAAAPAAESQA
jgi:small subunit ribosomal protein S16